MILFQCGCGTGCYAADEAAGQSVSCPKCGASIVIPSANDENLVLVFAKGTPEGGEVITLQELARGIADRRFCGIDLVWRDGGWKSLESQYEMPPEPEVTSPIAAPEIALRLAELPPAPGKNSPPDTGDAIVYHPKWTRAILIILLIAIGAGAIAFALWRLTKGGG